MEDRKKYIDKMAAKLKDWDDEIQQLQVKAGELTDDAKAKLQEQLKTLDVKQGEAQQKLSEIQEVSGSAWEDLKAGAELGWESLGDHVKQAWEIAKK